MGVASRAWARAARAATGPRGCRCRCSRRRRRNLARPRRTGRARRGWSRRRRPSGGDAHGTAGEARSDILHVVLHSHGRGGVVRPFGIGEQVATAADQHPAVRVLLGIVVTPAAVHRAGQPNRHRRGREHLQPRGADPARQLRQQQIQSAVDGDEHDARGYATAVRLDRTRRNRPHRRVLVQVRPLAQQRGGRDHPPGRVGSGVVGQVDAAAEVAVVVPHGDPMRPQRRRERRAVRGLVVRRRTRQPRQPNRPAPVDHRRPQQLREVVEFRERRPIQVRGTLAPRPDRVVQERSGPAQQKAAVTARRPGADPARVDTDHPQAALEGGLDRSQPRPAEADDTDIRGHRPVQPREP